MSALRPPHIAEDAGAHDLSDSEDHFSSASEGTPDVQGLSEDHSTIPQTRVERVDDRPAHGEVPGTAAYEKRLQDAVPDEIEVVPEGQRSRATSSLSQTSRPQTPGGTTIPKTVVERVDDKPAYGEVDGTAAKEMRMADAEPDEVRSAPPAAKDGRLNGSPPEQVKSADQQAWFRDMWEGKAAQEPEDNGTDDGNAEEHDDTNDNLEDDFDDFAEGDADDDDFGDFDEADETTTDSTAPHVETPVTDAVARLPPLDISGLSPADATQAFEPYFQAMFPDARVDDATDESPIHPNASAFVSDRSLSLWQQLVSPPPMQPPNWTRSRIRRLFLVSLGVPVDLDEILPPSKQKRLVLPNIELNPGSSRRSATLDHLHENAGNNASTTSVDSKGVPRRPKTNRAVSRGPPPAPEFDTNAASLLCSTTTEAMSVYGDDELRQHVMTLTQLNEKASSVLEYWLQRKDDGLKEKEALDGVIENLVGFVKGRHGK